MVDVDVAGEPVQVMLGSMRYSRSAPRRGTAVQHSPGEPCVKPLDAECLRVATWH